MGELPAGHPQEEPQGMARPQGLPGMVVIARFEDRAAAERFMAAKEAEAVA
jgi:hypothetical protein